MRPLRLEVEGFGTFRERTVVDFADVDLVALVGPTGSGKSTIIDAVTFALYGSVARYDNPARVAPVIHQLATEARVRLDFELAGCRYAAVRVVRRSKSERGAALRASTREARLERLGPDGSSTVLAGSVTELDTEVQRLVGLDFTQFTRTIVLPQGDFAELLTDDPGSRQQLIRRLLELDVYARMGAVARERASHAMQQVEVYQHELARLDGVSRQRLEAARARVAALAAFAADAATRLDRLAAVDTELARCRDEVRAAGTALGVLAGVAVPDDLAAADQRTAAARSQLAGAELACQLARAERDRAADDLDTAGDPFELQRQLQSRRRLDELEAAAAALEAELAEAETGRDALAGSLAGAEREASEAVDALRAARTGADAAPWVAQLLAGQPCPICRQPVIEPPERHDDHHLVHAAAEARADRCQAALSEVLAGAARADGRVQALEADLSHRRKEAGDLAGTVEGVAATEVLSAAAGLALAAADRAKQAATMLRAAEAAVTEAAAALDRLERAEQRFRRGFVEQWESAAGQGPPAPGGRSLADDWRGLSRWAAARSEALAADRDRAGAAGERLASTRAELIAGLAAAAEPLGVDPAPDQLAASVAAARATAEAEVTRLDEQLAHQRELATTVASLRQRQAVHASLGQHLAANGFERWLLAEALEAIVERATTRLEELTSGRYSLEVLDGSFHVRDHGNADERRDVRTLSGGEIFLASLALALALSESIAELAPLDAPQLDSIFLDEGFGSLDTETLDVVATAIEELSATGRLVVIVTHVRDLADRMPVRFEVSKGPATSTVERVES